jgi:hypothetical protein
MGAQMLNGTSNKLAKGLLLSTTLIVACSKASFTGDAPSRAKTEAPPLSSDGKIACVAEPASLAPGETATIKVTNTEAASQPELRQKLSLDGEGPSDEVESTLAYDVGSQVYTLGSGAANTAVAAKAGKYVIEIRAASGGGVKATCGFTAIAPGTVVGPTDTGSTTGTGTGTDVTTDPTTNPTTGTGTSTGTNTNPGGDDDHGSSDGRSGSTDDHGSADGGTGHSGNDDGTSTAGDDDHGGTGHTGNDDGTSTTGDDGHGGTPGNGDDDGHGGTPGNGDDDGHSVDGGGDAGSTDGHAGGDDGTGSTDGSIIPEPPCPASKQSVGAHLAFMIDNSNSNADTDCAAPVQIGTLNDAKLYECQGQTNRERAVLAAFDLLAAVSANEPSSAKAQSTIAISSFPTSADYVGGWQKETASWVDVKTSKRPSITKAMLFSRRPSGLTPYLGAISGAQSFFGGLAADEKARVAVLVTDGEPTDRDPSAVAAQAEALRAAGVEVITVFVNSGANRAQRAKEHIAMLKGIDTASVARTKHHWFDETKLGNFDAYIKTLLGGSGEPSLVDRVTSKVMSSCTDAPGKTCDRQIVEVANSGALKDAFTRIIKTKAIRCEQ